MSASRTVLRNPWRESHPPRLRGNGFWNRSLNVFSCCRKLVQALERACQIGNLLSHIADDGLFKSSDGIGSRICCSCRTNSQPRTVNRREFGNE